MASISDRTKFIGASDAAAIMGLDPWRSRVDVWLEKTGRAKDREKTAAMHRGNVLEPLLIDVASRKLKMPIVERDARCYLEGCDYVSAQLDAIMEDGRICEAKTAKFMVPDWGDGPDDIPTYYRCQVQAQLMVSGRENVTVVGGFGDEGLHLSQKFLENGLTMEVRALLEEIWTDLARLYHLRADPLFHKTLRQEIDRLWWQHVVTDIPPEPQSMEDVCKLWPEQGAHAVTADAECIDWLRMRNEGLKQRDIGDKVVKKCDDWLAGRMQDAVAIVDPTDRKPLYTLKQRAAYTVDAYTVEAKRIPFVTKFGKEIK